MPKEYPIRVEKKEIKESPLLDDNKKIGETAKEPEQIVVRKSNFWDKFFLRLSVEEKAVIAESITFEIDNKPLYWIQLVISVIIATLGLLQNSVVIILGAMLIAPLLRPIKGLAFGITTGRPRYFWKAFWMQFMSIIVVIFTAYVVSLVIPLKVETEEILVRTAPTLLDLLIAVAAGMIAVLSMYFKKLSENVAGVAMAASIMPPIAVTGIELSLNNIPEMGGSFFLFLTNLFAILAVGVLIFLMYGFYPDQTDSKKRVGRVVGILFVLLVFISFPLFSSLTNITNEIYLESHGREILEMALEKNYPDVVLASLNVVQFESNSVEFTGKLKVPSGFEFLSDNQDVLRQELVERLERDVDLELEIIPVIRIGNTIE